MIRVIKHFYKVGKATLKRWRCEHPTSYSASCPVTGKTYVTCSECLSRVDEYPTEAPACPNCGEIRMGGNSERTWCMNTDCAYTWLTYERKGSAKK